MDSVNPHTDPVKKPSGNMFGDMTIRHKLMAIIMVSTTVAVILLTISSILYDHILSKKQLVESLSVQSRMVGENCIASLVFDDTKDALQILESFRFNSSIEGVFILNSAGDVFAAYVREGVKGYPGDVNAGGHRFFQDHLVVSHEMRLHNELIGKTVIQSDLRFIYQSLYQRIIATGITVVIVLIISFLISSGLQRIIADPVLHLTDISARVSENKDYGLRAHVFSNDEIGWLTRSFNDMLGEVEKRDNELQERELMIAAKNRELEQIVYVVSHDLRSPLVNVDGYSRELELSIDDISRVMDERPSSDCPVEQVLRTEILDIRSALQLIRNSSRQMDKLLKGMLQLSRSGRASLTLETIDTNELLDRILATFDYQCRELGIVIDVDPLPPCVADDTQLGQIFSNLISNAVKYRDPERSLMVRISGKTHDGYVTFCVEDTGIGIAKEHQEKVFELFHRLNPSSNEGDGLGLTIVRQSLWRMDGTIHVESEPGRGSRFFVTLPAATRNNRGYNRGMNNDGKGE